MHEHHGLDVVEGNDFIGLLKVKPERARVGFHEHWSEAEFRDGEQRCDICIGRNDDPIAGMETPQNHIGLENQAQGIKPVTASHAAINAKHSGEFRFECFCFRSAQIPSRADNAQGCFLQLGAERSVFLEKIYEGDALRSCHECLR